MAKRAPDVIVIGGSAGSIEVVKTVLAGLPADLDAAVAVTLHRSPLPPSSLGNVFARSSSLRVVEPSDGDPFLPGRVYLAPADRHMLIRKDVIHLNREPRQHHTRPAIDPMFISAAETYQSRVIGLLLTGNLSDGVSGLIRIKAMRGISLVQDPGEAQYPSMPRNALIYDNVDLILGVQSLAPTLTGLVRGMDIDAVIATPGVCRPRAPDEKPPRWLAPGRRLP